MSTTWTENNVIPIIDDFDVCVVGGGVAGVAAALASAREGARTCIIEKEYALGGLATLGLIVIYLPLCDGHGRQVIGGLSEKLLKASIKYAPGTLPECWNDDSNIIDMESRKNHRYQTEFQAAPFMIAMEEMILSAGIKIYYDSRFCDVHKTGHHIDGIIIENKSGRVGIGARMIVDASGDADVCYQAGEKTVSNSANVCTGWYFSNGSEGVKLHICTDPLRTKLPDGHRYYSGDRCEDVTQHAIDGRRMIMENLSKYKRDTDPGSYPLIIPTYDGMRMTRRLSGLYTLDESEAFTDFPDSIGMTGDWRKPGPVFSLPWRILVGKENDNLAAAGRCISVSSAMWDITRVIPTAAVTGEAAGLGAALAAKKSVCLEDVDTKLLKEALMSYGVIIEKP